MRDMEKQRKHGFVHTFWVQLKETAEQMKLAAGYIRNFILIYCVTHLFLFTFIYRLLQKNN